MKESNNNNNNNNKKKNNNNNNNKNNNNNNNNNNNIANDLGDGGVDASLINEGGDSRGRGVSDGRHYANSSSNNNHNTAGRDQLLNRKNHQKSNEISLMSCLFPCPVVLSDEFCFLFSSQNKVT